MNHTLDGYPSEPAPFSGVVDRTHAHVHVQSTWIVTSMVDLVDMPGSPPIVSREDIVHATRMGRSEKQSFKRLAGQLDHGQCWRIGTMLGLYCKVCVLLGMAGRAYGIAGLVRNHGVRNLAEGLLGRNEPSKSLQSTRR